MEASLSTRDWSARTARINDQVYQQNVGPRTPGTGRMDTLERVPIGNPLGSTVGSVPSQFAGPLRQPPPAQIELIARPQPVIPAVLMFSVIVDRDAAAAKHLRAIILHHESGIAIDADA